MLSSDDPLNCTLPKFRRLTRFSPVFRSESSNLFDCYFETELDPVSKKPRVHFKYPSAYNDKEVIRSVPDFCFPCDIQFNAITHFSFVLTAQNHQWSYFFVRHHGESKCLVLMSSFPWATTFFKLLNYISDIKSKYDVSVCFHFVTSGGFRNPINSMSLAHPFDDYRVRYQLLDLRLSVQYYSYYSYYHEARN